MLRDGSIVDSTMLPQNSVQEHPVTISAESLVRTVMSTTQAQGQAITFSGGDIMDTAEAATPRTGIYESVTGDLGRRRDSLEDPVYTSAYDIDREGLRSDLADLQVAPHPLRLRSAATSGQVRNEEGSSQGANVDRGLPAMRSEPSSPRALQRRRISLAQTNPQINVAAGQRNLERHQRSIESDQPLRYHPVSLSEFTASSVTSLGRVPGASCLLTLHLHNSNSAYAIHFFTFVLCTCSLLIP